MFVLTIFKQKNMDLYFLIGAVKNVFIFREEWTGKSTGLAICEFAENVGIKAIEAKRDVLKIDGQDIRIKLFDQPFPARKKVKVVNIDIVITYTFINSYSVLI